MSEHKFSAQYIHFHFLRRLIQSADHSGFLFLRKFQKWAANHSCGLQSVRTGSQRGKKEKSLPVNLVRLLQSLSKNRCEARNRLRKYIITVDFFYLVHSVYEKHNYIKKEVHVREITFQKTTVFCNLPWCMLTAGKWLSEFGISPFTDRAKENQSCQKCLWLRVYNQLLFSI